MCLESKKEFEEVILSELVRWYKGTIDEVFFYEKNWALEGKQRIQEAFNDKVCN